MIETYFLLFDTGISERYPGFPPDFFFSDLPVAGSFNGIEISAANSAGFPSSGCGIVTDPSRIKLLSDKVKDWSFDIDVIPYRNDVGPVLDFLEKLAPARLAIHNLSSLISVDSTVLQSLSNRISDNDLVKCSVDGIPVDFFTCTYPFFSHFVSSSRDTGDRLTVDELFKQLLLQFTELPDVPGTVYLHNTLFSLYRTYRACIGSHAFLHPGLYRLYEKKPKDSEIGKNGSVRNSLLAPGSKIDGHVENSFVFENVTVREGASITNSIIFPGHTIGKKAVIKNSVLLPFTLDPAPGTTIGDKSIIGGRSKASNKVFPDHIQDGISVIGFNTEIPAGTVMEPAACIDWNVAKAEIKRKRVIKKGAYISGED